MIFRNLWRHLRDAFRNMRRNSGMTLGSIISVSLTLIIVGSLLSALVNLNVVAERIANDVTISVYVDHVLEEDQVTELGDKISDFDEVKTVEFRTKEEELAQLESNYSSSFSMLEGDANPLYDVYVVDVSSSDFTGPTANQIKDLDGVVDVDYGGNIADRLFSIIGNLRNIGIGIVIFLVVVAVFMIYNTTRLGIASRRDEIEIQRLVGAKKSYIRGPYLVEGFIIGLVSAAIAIGLLFYLYEPAVQATTSLLAGQASLPVPSWPFLLYLSGILLVLGILISIVGTAFSMGRYLRR